MKYILIGVSMLLACDAALARKICTTVDDRFGDSQYRPGYYDETHISGSKPYSLIAHDLTPQPYPNNFATGEEQQNVLEMFYAIDLDDRDNYIQLLTMKRKHWLTLCIDTKKVLFYGDNYAGRENIGYASRNNENTSTLSFKTELNFGGSTKTICDLRFPAGQLQTKAGCYDYHFTATLADLDPGLYRRLQTARKELDILIEEGKDIDRELKGKAEDLDRSLEKINKKIFVQLHPSDFNNIESLLDKYESLKLEINALHKENEVLKAEFNEIYTEAAEDINSFVANSGISIDSFSTPPTVEMSGLDINLESLDYSSEFSSELYNDYAQNTLNKLKDLYSENKNKEFIQQTKLWIKTTGELKRTLDLHITSSPDEWEEMIQSFEIVENYVFSVIDNDFWFKDSPVTPAQREAIESIGKVSPKWASIIDNDLRTYRNSNHTEGKQNILLTLEALGNGIEGVGAENVDASEFEETFAGMAEAIKEGTVCAAKVIAFSDFGDFYEIVIGKDLCTGEALSTGERFVSVIGVAFGSARFWRYVAKTSGIIADTKHFINVSSNLKEQAAKFGMTHAQLQNMANKLAKLYPCK